MKDERGYMKLTADFHTHTKYSDGDNTLLENALKAKELGITALGATEHGFSHKAFGIKRKEMNDFIRECREAEEATGVKMLVGIESNIRGRSGLCDLMPEEYEMFDIYLAGIHVYLKYETFHDSIMLGFHPWLKTLFHCKPSKRMIKETTEAYINAIEKNPIDILTHINYMCFSDPVEVAKCCRDNGTYLEISGKKQHLTDEQLAEVAATGVRFVINSDAHSINRIGDSVIAEEQIKRVGISLDQIDNINGKMPNFRFAEYKKRNL